MAVENGRRRLGGNICKCMPISVYFNSAPIDRASGDSAEIYGGLPIYVPRITKESGEVSVVLLLLLQHLYVICAQACAD